jgi:hypothetical protein
MLLFWAVSACAGNNVETPPSGPDGAADAARIRACVEDFSSGLGLADAGGPVSFRREVMPLLVTHCNLNICHESGSPPSHLGLGATCTFDPRTMTCVADPSALTDAIAQSVYANLTASSHAGPGLKRVEPGRIDRSFLLMKLSACQDAFPDLTGCADCGTEMPPHGSLRQHKRPLFDMVAQWVRDGAPFD